MKHPLKCPKCGEFRFVEFQGFQFNNENGTKGFGSKIPIFKCASCGGFESILPQRVYDKFKEDMMPSINEGEFVEMPLKYIVVKLNPENKFKHYEHLGFEYDPRDYYLIPGLCRQWEDGYLTPVFFDKDLLLYYNHHPDYSVKLTSFSSGNVYYKGEAMFAYGFGINRSGKIFKWLGDLDKDFRDASMNSHLKRFQASNIASDHDIVSKFYLSQIPFSPSDAFQDSDNESELFQLKNDFNNLIKKKYGFEITKVDIEQLSDYYKPPILEERDQVFSAFLSLNKYFVENLQEKSLKDLLLNSGLNKQDLEKDGIKFGTLKLLALYIEKVLAVDDSSKVISPLFVLNDLRQLHGHLSENSFETRYNFCKERLGLDNAASDLDVFKSLITRLIDLFQNILKYQEVRCN